MSRSPTELAQIEIEPGTWLSAARSLYLATEKTLVVADIHWGYAQSHRRVGNLLPIWGNREIAQRLHRLIEHYEPRRLIWLGDSLHAPAAASIAEDFLREIAFLEVIIIRGNHDRAWPRADHVEYRLGPWLFHHGDRVREVEEGVIEVIGHIHPAISWSDGAGLRLKVPVLVQGRRRLILPSFSDWSSGAVWNDRLEADEKMWLISSRKIWPVTREQLDRA